MGLILMVSHSERIDSDRSLLMINRRQLLGAAAAAAAGAKAAPTLALNGGKPVREKPLKAGYWGSEFYDDKERAELMDVLDARSPFRWYGPGAAPKRGLTL